MRDADTVLGIIHERSKQGLPLEDIYRQLYNPHLYLLAYDRLRNNKGALTPGVTGETVDGMKLSKIQRLIEALRFERHRWHPARRRYIPKKNGKLRPLGIPIFPDKLLQEVMRQILEAYYEPQFSPYSHGFRPNKGCHTALRTIRTWTGTRWFIEGDIKGCFDNIDHNVLMSLLSEKFHDNRFLRLTAQLLKAGYMEDWKYHATYSGTPQGGVISPILSNIYLDQLDKFVETTLLPAYNRGDRRQWNPEYVETANAIKRESQRKSPDLNKIRELKKRLRTLPSYDQDDPDFRRLWYVRYADDFLMGFIGPKAEAVKIKHLIREFLREKLKLELSDEKTLITHACDERARFLSYEIRNQQNQTKLRNGRRSVNGRLALLVPRDVVIANCQACMKRSKPIHRRGLCHLSDYTIVSTFQSEYRGLVQYYKLANNVHALGQYRWVKETALLKTLANKHKTTVTAIVEQLKATKETPHGSLTCFRVTAPHEGKPPLVAEFGGIPLRRDDTAIIHEIPYRIWNKRTDLIKRLLADRCAQCGTRGDCEVHHIRKLATLRKKGKKELPQWQQIMIAMRRKTLVVCRACHEAIHHKPKDIEDCRSRRAG